MELMPLAVSLGIGLAVGFAAGYNSYESRIHSCVERVEQGSNYGPVAYRAFLFAQCVKPSQYDPQYDYKRFKGK